MKLWKPIQVQPKISVMKSNVAQADAVTRAVARSIIAFNIPFSAADHPVWRQMFHTLRAGSNPGCGRTLSTTVLDELFEEDRASWTKDLEGQLLAMSCDGWTSPTGKPVFGICLSDPHYPPRCNYKPQNELTPR